MKVNLQNGICAARWSCKNIDKECCHLSPIDNNTFVECEHYNMTLIKIELGCGDRKHENCIGLDKRKTKHVDIICNIAKLPIKSETVDEIYAISVLEHFENPYVVLDEIYRILKKGRKKTIIHVPNLGTYDAHLCVQSKESHKFLADWYLWNLILTGYFNKVETKPWHVKYRSSSGILRSKILYVLQRLFIVIGFYDFARGFYFICSDKKEIPQQNYKLYCW